MGASYSTNVQSAVNDVFSEAVNKTYTKYEQNCPTDIRQRVRFVSEDEGSLTQFEAGSVQLKASTMLNCAQNVNTQRAIVNDLQSTLENDLEKAGLGLTLPGTLSADQLTQKVTNIVTQEFENESDFQVIQDCTAGVDQSIEAVSRRGGVVKVGIKGGLDLIAEQNTVCGLVGKLEEEVTNTVKTDIKNQLVQDETAGAILIVIVVIVVVVVVGIVVAVVMYFYSKQLENVSKLLPTLLKGALALVILGLLGGGAFAFYWGWTTCDRVDNQISGRTEGAEGADAGGKPAEPIKTCQSGQKSDEASCGGTEPDPACTYCCDASQRWNGVTVGGAIAMGLGAVAGIVAGIYFMYQLTRTKKAAASVSTPLMKAEVRA